MVINVSRQVRGTNFAAKNAIAISFAARRMASVKIGSDFLRASDADGGGQNIIERDHEIARRNGRVNGE